MKPSSERSWAAPQLRHAKVVLSAAPPEPEFTEDVYAGGAEPTVLALSRLRAARILEDAREQARLICEKSRQNAELELQDRLGELERRCQDALLQQLAILAQEMQDYQTELRNRTAQALGDLVLAASAQAWSEVLSSSGALQRAVEAALCSLSAGPEQKLTAIVKHLPDKILRTAQAMLAV